MRPIEPARSQLDTERKKEVAREVDALLRRIYNDPGKMGVLLIWTHQGLGEQAPTLEFMSNINDPSVIETTLNMVRERVRKGGMSKYRVKDS